MRYPIEVINDPILGSFEREMSPETYEKRLTWYKDYSKKFDSDPDASRRDREYAQYLKRWFSNENCDGLPNFKARHSLHQLPMPINIYFN